MEEGRFVNGRILCSLSHPHNMFPRALYFLFCVCCHIFLFTGITITQKQATIAMTGLSVLVLIWLLNHIFWMTIGTSGFLCGVHCLLRDASMHKDESDRVIMQGDLSLDDDDGMGMDSEARFLNDNT